MDAHLTGSPAARARPTFLSRYAEPLRKWTDALESTDAPIVAIARKGPRLLELLAVQGVMRRSCLDRVVSERALPFLSAPSSLVVIDDAVAWGSTFAHVARLAANCVETTSGAVTGLPFAVSEAAHEEHRSAISRSFLRLRARDVAPFVSSEIVALRHLAKPADIEHPIISLAGGPFDPSVVDAALLDVAGSMGGEVARIPSRLTTDRGVRETWSWTLLLPEPSAPRSQFSKIRIYLGDDPGVLTLIAIQPHLVSSLESPAAAGLPNGPPFDLWVHAADRCVRRADAGIGDLRQRSLVAWANYLAAVPLAKYVARAISSTLSELEIEAAITGPSAFDIQLLVGPELARQAEVSLRSYVADPATSGREGWNDANRAVAELAPVRFRAEVIPESYAADYRGERRRFLEQAHDAHDALEGIFFAQHAKIELASRTPSDLQQHRLDFGITLPELRRLTFDAVPGATDIQIHSVLDTLIDEGAVVPRYLDLGESAGAPVWGRAFRVGEGPIPKRAHAIRLLCASLARELETQSKKKNPGPDAEPGAEGNRKPDELPALTLEKHCVIALAGLVPDKRLDPFRALGIEKQFHLYGARPYLPAGRDPRFLLDWAVRHGLLATGVGSDGRVRSYTLCDTSNTYPIEESPWDDEAQEALEDVAALTTTLRNVGSKTRNADALVLVTSLASHEDFHRATAAELWIWLYDENHSVYRALAEVGQLATAIKSGSDDVGRRLKAANAMLAATANVTAQVKFKSELFAKRDEIYKAIDVEVAGNAGRIWRRLRKDLDSRAVTETHASGLEQVLSALRVAHASTRPLRELLVLAGWKDDRSIGLRPAIERLRRMFDDPLQVDPVTRRAFSACEEGSDISVLLDRVLDADDDGFIRSFDRVRPAIMQIAGVCANILSQFGPGEQQEAIESLEPPQYVLMWDVRGSTGQPRPDDLQRQIALANKRLGSVLGSRGRDFDPESTDDGNGFVCSDFKDVLVAFRVLNDALPGFRAGCEVNFQGRLTYFPVSKRLGGRAFEHAARIAALFKEIKADPKCWNGSLPTEPVGSYLAVGEFARRFAQSRGQWDISGMTSVTLQGEFTARVHGAIPVGITLISVPEAGGRDGRQSGGSE